MTRWIILIFIRSRNESTKSSYLFSGLIFFLFFVSGKIDHTLCIVYPIRIQF